MLKSCSQPKLNYIKLLLPISPKHVFSFFILHLSLLETIYNNLLLRIQNSQKSITPDSRCNITRPWICFNFCLKSRKLLLFLSPAVNSSSSFMLFSPISIHQVTNFIHHHVYLFFYGTGKKKTKIKLVFRPHISYLKGFHFVGARQVPLSFEKRSTRNIKNKTLIWFSYN